MRAFVALELPPPVRAACDRALEALRGPAGRLRLAPAGQLHVTLAFLGEIDQARADGVADALRPVVAATPGWPLAIRGCGAFPDLGRPRVLWFGVEDSDGRCGALQAAVWRALQPLGFVPEARPFRPHVTFARVRTGRIAPALRAALLARADFDGGQAPAAHVQLMESRLEPGGARYHPLATFALA
jgi:2'-5' RNA ligase